ncbi:MAG: type 1 glutamine amidotransferase [Deltaproteobacteria bacterium]|nr:type 1 glutamine amidotransferase [Deltaproteobacteria bacterium]
MENILIIIHDSHEGPGTLGTFLESTGAGIRTIKLYESDTLPDDPRDVDAIVSMGGPMSVYDEEIYPFLRQEKEFLAKSIDANIPILGICLGAQLIASACHTEVFIERVHEVGWSKVSITEEAKRDILFQGLSRTLRVFQWHKDVFDIPEGATIIATSKACPNQAFRYKNAYGLQFHVEVTRDMLAEWMKDVPEGAKILRGHSRIAQEFERQAQTIYSNFLWLADIRQRAVKSLRKTNGD